MKKAILMALSQVSDPEVGENIVDLGLIYAIAIDNDIVRICLTMTSPSCPMAEMLLEQIRQTLAPLLEPEYSLDLELVWQPVWSPDMMSDAAKQRLGWF